MLENNKNISYIFNNDSKFREIINGIADNYKTSPDKLPENTPISNHLFNTFINDSSSNTPSVVKFSARAYSNLQDIRKLAQIINSVDVSEGKTSQSLDFVCFGENDSNNNIIINSIVCPIYNEACNKKYRESFQNGEFKWDSIVEYIRKNNNSINSKDSINSMLLKHLKYNSPNFVSKSMATAILFGSTKYYSSENNYYNCFSLSELSEAIIPPTTKIYGNNIITGAIAITPTIEDNINNGSLEIALVSYKNDRINDNVIPIKISNVKRAEFSLDSIISEWPASSIKISSSYQPTDNVYNKNNTSNHSM